MRILLQCVFYQMMLTTFLFLDLKNCFIAILTVAVSTSSLQSSNIQPLGISSLSREKKIPEQILETSQGFPFANLS